MYGWAVVNNEEDLKKILLPYYIFHITKWIKLYIYFNQLLGNPPHTANRSHTILK